jgi:hypothetical protein
MSFVYTGLVSAGGLFLGMLGSLEVGRRLGMRRLASDPEGARAGFGAVEGAVFGLLGLLVAFTFSGAAGRFDVRRQLIVEETNAIGTAWLRIDLLSPNAQPPLRDSFRRYVDARLSAYGKLPDVEAAFRELARANAMQGEIWTRAVTACRTDGSPPATMLLLPALNQMIDITTTRTMAAQTHPPTIVFAMLSGLALVSSLLAGYGMAGGKRRSWVHMVSLAAILATTVYVIGDIEYPRLGLIRVEAFDQTLVDLRRSMN